MSSTRRRCVHHKKRPENRSECRGGKRPCPWVSCRYHLYLDVNVETGSIKFNYPDKELWELEHTCALDVAEQGEKTFEEIGGLLNLTRERIRQLTNATVIRVGEAVFDGDLSITQGPIPWMPCDAESPLDSV